MAEQTKTYLVKDYAVQGVYDEEGLAAIKDRITDYTAYDTAKEAAEAFIESNYAYHFTSIENMPSILQNGLLANHQLREQEIGYSNIAKNDIQERREQMVIPGTELTIHDCVPFYFTNHSPMLLGVINRKLVDQKDLVYMVLKLKVLEREDVYFTDASANTDVPPHFYGNIEDLTKLHWDIINSPKWKYDDTQRKQKMAEVLIPDKVSAWQLSYFVVFDEEARDRLQQMLDEVHLNKQIRIVNSKMSYYYRKMIPGREHESLVTGPNELFNLCRSISEKIAGAARSGNEKFADLPAMLAGIREDFDVIKELSDINDLETANPVHERKVGEHTRDVVDNLKKYDPYNELTEEQQMLVTLAAYFHDIGKGPKEKWPDGKQLVYEDHPADSLKMLERILTEDVAQISAYEAKILCVLVAYHDLLGAIYGKPENEQRPEAELDRIIREFALSEGDVKMLLLLSKADTAALVLLWATAICEHEGEILAKVRA